MLSKNLKKALCLVTAFSLIACSMPADSAKAAKKATLKNKKLTITVGSSKKITIKNKSSKKKYTFKTNKKAVAKVNKAGKVTGVKAGKAKITVFEALKKKPKKTKKIGVCNIVVKNKKVDPTQAPTTVPTQAPTTAPVVTTAPTQAPTAAPTEAPTERPTIVPAYEKKTLDFNGSNSIEINSYETFPLTTAMIYGGICNVSLKIKHNESTEQEFMVGYEGEYYNFKRNGAYIDKNNSAVEPMTDYSTVTVAGGDAVTKEISFTVPKYSYDFNLFIQSTSGIVFTVEDVTIETKPFESADDYAGMVANSTKSTGNNARIKKAIEKARAGEDVTLAYLGGSITEGFAASETKNSDCYAETSYNQFKQMYGKGDGSNVHFINAGMSGTPSTLGIIRYQKNVLEQMEYGEYPDILFIDFAVNDGSDCAEAYESIIRTALEQGSAVVLMFVLYISGCAHESDYSKIGEAYNIPMVSPAQGMASCDKKEFDTWFYWPDDGHPDVGGHRYMADCISNMFKTIDAEEAKEDDKADMSSFPLYKNARFTGMKTLDSATDISKHPSVKSITVGGFSEKDTSQPKLQYIKDGVVGMNWFPDAWAHTASSGDESFKVELTCNSIMLGYKQAGNGFGKADVYLDGKKVSTITNANGGWDNACTLEVLASDEVAEHVLEIKMADDSKNLPFTIYSIGYANKDEK